MKATLLKKFIGRNKIKIFWFWLEINVGSWKGVLLVAMRSHSEMRIFLRWGLPNRKWQLIHGVNERKINVQNGFVKEQRECVERNEESIIPWLREEEMVQGEQTNNQKYNKIKKQASKTNLGCEKKRRCKANSGQVVLCHWRPGVCNETNPCCWKWDKFLLFLQFCASKQRKARS